jgi:osmotically-inducible protein OsmY
MRTTHLPAACAIILALLWASGCDEMTVRGAAPDDTPGTQRAIDQVNADARTSKQDIDQALRDQSLNIAFRQNLIKETAAHQNEQVDIDRDKVVQPLKITMQSTREQAKADQQAIDLDAGQKLKAPGAQEPAITADHTTRLAELERKTAESVAAINAEIDKADAKAKQQHALIEKDRQNRLIDTSMELEADERTARQKKADIDNATIRKLNAISEASSDRTTKDRAAEQRTRDADMKITKTIRDEVDSDKSLAMTSKDIEITTAKGVVQVSGTVPSEADRQAIIAKAKKVDGVVRVDSLIAVR